MKRHIPGMLGPILPLYSSPEQGVPALKIHIAGTGRGKDSLQEAGSSPQICLLSLNRLQAGPEEAFQPLTFFLQGHHNPGCYMSRTVWQKRTSMIGRTNWDLSQPGHREGDLWDGWTSASWPMAAPAEASLHTGPPTIELVLIIIIGCYSL